MLKYEYDKRLKNTEVWKWYLKFETTFYNVIQYDYDEAM